MKATFATILKVMFMAGAVSVHAAPGEPTVSGSSITNSASVADVKVEGVQGASGGGGGGIGFGRFRIGGSGSRQTASMASEMNVGQVGIHGGTLSGSTITQQASVANATVRGGTLNVGQTQIGAAP